MTSHVSPTILFAVDNRMHACMRRILHCRMADNSHPCPECGRVFRHAAWMRKHCVKHQPAGQFPCTHSGCSKRLKSEDALRTHIRTQHEDRSAPLFPKAATARCPLSCARRGTDHQITPTHLNFEKQNHSHHTRAYVSHGLAPCCFVIGDVGCS